MEPQQQQHATEFFWRSAFWASAYPGVGELPLWQFCVGNRVAKSGSRQMVSYVSVAFDKSRMDNPSGCVAENRASTAA